MITLVKANKELKKVVDYLEENESAWDKQRNLKLYDAAFYDYKEDFPLTFKKYGENEFTDFCEVEYDGFLEWLTDENIEKNILHYIGRTSSFYVGEYGGEGIVGIINDIYNNNVYGNAFNYINISSDYKITPFGEWKLIDDEVQDELNYIVSNLFDDVKAVFEPIIKVANYIDDYKAYQVSIFKEYLNYEEEELQSGKTVQMEYNHQTNEIKVLKNKMKRITLDD